MNTIKKLYQKYREVINYLIVGVLTTVISLVTYYALVQTLLNPENSLELQIANVISWIISVLFAYITNRKFVFQSKSNQITKEFTSFIGSRVLTVLHGNDKLMKLISQVVVIVANYLLSKLFVFQKKKPESN